MTCAALDWTIVLERAKRSGVQPALLLGLYLAAQVGGIALPAPLAKTLQAHSPTRRYAAQIIGQGAASRIWDQAPVGAPFSPGFPFQGHLRAAARWFLVPRVEDWTATDLPDALYPLYYIIRPLRLLAKYGGRVFSRQ